MRTLVVIPTYNESENVAELITEVFKLQISALNILVVDDNSPDGTADKVLDLAGTYVDQLYLLKRPGKLGLGTAYLEGFRWGLERGYDVFVEMDADFSHNPKYLPDLLDEINNHDFVVASRYVKDGGVTNWGLLRRFISRFGSFYARKILGIPVRDMTGGFNLWRSEVLETIGLENVRSNGYAFQVELKYRAWQKGFRFKESPIVFVDRDKGKSKMSKKIVLEAMWMVWRLRMRTVA